MGFCTQKNCVRLHESSVPFFVHSLCLWNYKFIYYAAILFEPQNWLEIIKYKNTIAAQSALIVAGKFNLSAIYHISCAKYFELIIVQSQ